MFSLEEFHTDFLQSILSDTIGRGLLKSQAFFEHICEQLVFSGDLTNNYTMAEYIKKGVEVHGYDYDDERKILSLIVNQFFQEDAVQTLTKSLVDTKFNRLKTFFQQTSRGLFNQMEETSPSFSMAYSLHSYIQNKKINKIQFIILTDGKTTKHISSIASEQLFDIPACYKIIDIEYLYKTYFSESSNIDSIVNVKLPALAITSASDDYKSYLSVINGQTLFDIYEKYGQKLFEHNVRMFLQFKGSVNKGLRNTIQYNAERFFAYNNGITAIASDVEVDKDNYITKLTNFQIVNGGQTTSAIYAAHKNHKLDLTNIFVQMKLSVVKNKEVQNDFVADVSEYANTQNKVNKSDFFSNSSFHKEMKNYSQRTWAPAIDGSQRRTHWFYERARGEYLNEQAYLTISEKKRFLLENPKHQFLDKTFLAKSETAWSQQPDIVSRGAQYSFSHFADKITKKIEDNKYLVSESYFKNVVSRVILFKATEKIISTSSWYDGGYRAQTVAYSISLLSNLIETTGKVLNFDLIWQLQSLPRSLIKNMEVISQTVYNEITNPPVGFANIGQWCKKNDCWTKVKSLKLNVIFENEILVDSNEQKNILKDDRRNKKIDSAIEMQAFVVNVNLSKWNRFLNHFRNIDPILTNIEFGILERMSLGLLQPPSEKQSKVLYQIFERATEIGIT